jgi:transposase-like protein
MDLESRFSTKEACLSYLEKIRWPEGFKCLRCGSDKAWKTKRGTFFCSGCEFQTSVTSGTIFDGVRKPLTLWFRAVWLVTSQKNGISALSLQRQLGLSRYETAWAMLQRLRQAMIRPGLDLLSGEVEVDETIVGGPTLGKKGRDIEGKALVVIAAEKNGDKTGRIRMQRIPNANAETLEAFVKTNIQKKSIVETDGWTSYLGLTDLGYKHRRIKGESVGVEELVPRVHQVASLLKRWLLGTHQGGIDKTHLDGYLNEFTFRFNRRTSANRGKLFRRLIEQAVQIGSGTMDSGS